MLRSINPFFYSFLKTTDKGCVRSTLFFIYSFVAVIQAFASTDTWRGLVISDEKRCSPYNRAIDYGYPQSVEAEIVKSMDNKIYSPYTGEYFESTDQTDIDHIVALSEAHDSGLCASDQAAKSKFASDVQNLTLASLHLNRHIKGSSDAAEWLPDKNKCWFANKVLSIKRSYGLSVDSDELIALEKVLSKCATSEISYNKVNTDQR